MDLSIFSVIAEIGIALVGFSGIVVALTRPKTDLSPVHRYRMYALMNFGSEQHSARLFGHLQVSLLP